ncbi:MAG: hypothetical protein AABX01_01065 [Candidatus Micrarchaeota archaeon]
MGRQIVAIFLISILLLFGCTQPKPEPTAVPTSIPTQEPTKLATATPTPVPSPTPEAFQPLRLDYEFKQSGGSQGGPSRNQYFTLWLNEKKDCGSRKAYLGVMQSSEDRSMPEQNTAWSKITIYEDDGTMATTNWAGKSDLAFDNAKSANMDFNFFLTLNDIFASAGKNFLTDEVWKSATPVILKNVKFGNNYANLSIMKGDEESGLTIPCTKFLLLEQGQGPSEMDACVAKITKKMPLPFTVSYKIANDFDMELAKVSNEKSSVVYYPQCLEKVSCTPVAQPAQNEQDACRQKNGQFDPINDDRNCVTKYACRTDRDRIIADLRQAASCGAPSDAIISKALQCRSSNMGWNAQNDQNGCITSITCGNQPQN